jgi:hypothetical protein
MSKNEIIDAINAHVPHADRALLLDLLTSDDLGDQSHLFQEFPKVFQGADIADKIRSMAQQLKKLNQGYPGGLRAYILNAKQLLKGIVFLIQIVLVVLGYYPIQHF